MGGLRSGHVEEQLALALAEAEASHSPVHVGRTVHALYKAVAYEGMGDRDFASLYRFVYGAGAGDAEWKGGDALFNHHAP